MGGACVPDTGDTDTDADTDTDSDVDECISLTMRQDFDGDLEDWRPEVDIEATPGDIEESFTGCFLGEVDGSTAWGASVAAEDDTSCTLSAPDSYSEPLQDLCVYATVSTDLRGEFDPIAGYYEASVKVIWYTDGWVETQSEEIPSAADAAGHLDEHLTYNFDESLIGDSITWIS
ncbi:MAG: hypothetical protein EXR69_00455 [Myxococcales bacterium]|nr:hypothetical protein [Myxococcales bacterium]